jgi:hypothetical protein
MDQVTATPVIVGKIDNKYMYVTMSSTPLHWTHVLYGGLPGCLRSFVFILSMYLSVSCSCMSLCTGNETRVLFCSTCACFLIRSTHPFRRSSYRYLNTSVVNLVSIAGLFQLSFHRSSFSLSGSFSTVVFLIVRTMMMQSGNKWKAIADKAWVKEQWHGAKDI